MWRNVIFSEFQTYLVRNQALLLAIRKIELSFDQILRLLAGHVFLVISYETLVSISTKKASETLTNWVLF